MTQGQGASVLVRAFAETSQAEYLKGAIQAVEVLCRDENANGLCARVNGGLMPQEYPKPVRHVLNGAITAFFGLHDVAVITENRNLLAARDEILESFARILPQYDAGYWSWYSLSPKRLGAPHYHDIHIDQLTALLSISGDDRFRHYADLFSRYREHAYSRFLFSANRTIQRMRDRIR